MKNIKSFGIILLGILLLLSISFQTVLAAEKTVKLTVPGCV